MTVAELVSGHVLRVTVVTDRVEVDLTVPATVPVVSVLPAVVSVIDRHCGSATVEGSRAAILAGPSGAPLDGARSLLENGIRNGDMLLLHDAEAVLPTPLFDDVAHAVSVSAREPQFTAQLSRRLAGSVAVVVATATAALIVGRLPDHLMAGALALVAAVVLLAIGLTARTLFPVLAALPLLAAGGAQIVPGSGAPNVLLAAALVASGALAAGAVSRLWRSTIVAVVCGAGAVALAALWCTVWNTSPRQVGAVLAAAGIVLLSLAPKASLTYARLTVPEADGPEFTTSDHDRSYAVIRSRTARAQQYLTGAVVGLSVAIGIGAICTAAPNGGEISTPAAAFAFVVAAVLALRGRTHIDRTRATAQVVVGASIAVLVSVAMGVWAPERVVVAIGALALLTAGVTIMGLIPVSRRWTPVQRRAGEVAEYVVIAALVPLLVWTLDLFTVVRGL